jgi:hypothetical protein
MMNDVPLPPSAAWLHRDSREGFESVLIARHGGRVQLDGHTAAVEAGVSWVVRYSITVGDDWLTESARVWSWSSSGERHITLRRAGSARWRLDGRPAPHLDGCADVDLESSACTNTIPVHRLRLAVGAAADAPAAYVRAPGLEVERLEQRYERLPDDGGQTRYAYEAPVFGFAAQLTYDPSVLVVDYPGIATRRH